MKRIICVCVIMVENMSIKASNDKEIEGDVQER